MLIRIYTKLDQLSPRILSTGAGPVRIDIRTMASNTTEVDNNEVENISREVINILQVLFNQMHMKDTDKQQVMS